jgi:hypothetical protein
MSKKYAILAAGLVASGRSLSTTSIVDQRAEKPKHTHAVGNRPFFDAIDFALAEFGRDPRMSPVGPAADHVAIAR